MTKTLRVLYILAAFAMLPLAMQAQGKRYYVTKEAETAQAQGDGSSWSTAMTLQQAIGTATAGDEIWVKGYEAAGGGNSYVVPEGGYTLKSGVSLYGGFSGEDGNTIEPEYTEEEQLQRAQEMISRVTDEESFKTLCLEYCTEEEVEDFRDGDASLARGMSYDTVSANMGEEEADWAFSADRQAGETTVWQTDSYIYAVYLVKPAYRSEQNYVSVRHLLVQFPEEETSTSEEIVSEPTTNEDGETTVPEETEPETHMHDGVAYEGAKHDDADGDTVYKETPKNNDDAKRIAEEYLAKYNEGEKTEEAFAALADLYSDDTSSTTDGGGEGGLIENMKPGQYVQPFEDWAYDEARKPGDVGIVETDYGYHVMYFVGAEEEPIWKTDIRNALASEKVTEETEADEEEYAGILTETSSMERAYRACVEFAASKRYS